MGKSIWIYRETLSDDVQAHLKTMIGHLPGNDQKKIIEVIEESLAVYIQLTEIEENLPLVRKQKKEIEDTIKQSLKVVESLYGMSDKTKEVISICYQKQDSDEFLRLKFLEKEIPKLLIEYSGMLSFGQASTYDKKGLKITKNKENHRKGFILGIRNILKKYDIKTPASTTSPFHELIKLLLEQNNEFISEVAEVKKLNQG